MALPRTAVGRSRPLVSERAKTHMGPVVMLSRAGAKVDPIRKTIAASAALGDARFAAQRVIEGQSRRSEPDLGAIGTDRRGLFDCGRWPDAYACARRRNDPHPCQIGRVMLHLGPPGHSSTFCVVAGENVGSRKARPCARLTACPAWRKVTSPPGDIGGLGRCHGWYLHSGKGLGRLRVEVPKAGPRARRGPRQRARRPRSAGRVSRRRRRRHERPKSRQLGGHRAEAYGGRSSRLGRGGVGRVHHGQGC